VESRALSEVNEVEICAEYEQDDDAAVHLFPYNTM
jgi:hypothetical protein